MDIPEKARLEGLEDRWAARWADDGTFRFDRKSPREHVYAIDTPPPTVSGDLHIGHCFSYTHTDVMARYQRMRGREVFYPMGFDDNGLNTERRVQLLLGITCDPSLPYEPKLVPPGPDGPVRAVSRRNFTELCEQVTLDLEETYRHLWRRLGLSVDWEHHYTTIGPRAQAVSQRAFLDLLNAGRAYRADAPTSWDAEFHTAVAQAEMVEREVAGAWHRLRFGGPDGDLLVDTTRPELLAACVALVAHASDERYLGLVGQSVRTPLFGVEVPVHTHDLADPSKGTGLAMVCTFGDATDVEWWRDLDLPVRPVIGKDGRLQSIDWTAPSWASADPAAARAASGRLAGLSVADARALIVELLRDAGALDGEPRRMTHTVRFWENGNQDLETIVTGQWFVRTTDRIDEWRGYGEQLRWHPEFMHQRYRDWVDGLASDWNISRQRYFGVPFPVWYPLEDDGQPRFDRPITADPTTLPVDPSSDTPPGYAESQRGEPGGFTADTDVMDTWATSSLTPQIVGGWLHDPDLYERVFPFDLRPQAHEIIRTWTFTTIVRSHELHGTLPWSDAAISGFVVDPDRKKLAKSLANADESPEHVIDAFGADAVRYWAASARLGVDATFDHNVLRIGRRLALKLLNVSRFVLLVLDRAGASGRTLSRTDVIDADDLAWLSDLDTMVAEATAAFESFRHDLALRTSETAFWSFCDDYVEAVKTRAYGEVGDGSATSAHASLVVSLSTFQRLLAPFIPFACEEAWSWWQNESVHRSPWPAPPDVGGGSGAQVTFAAHLRSRL